MIHSSFLSLFVRFFARSLLAGSVTLCAVVLMPACTSSTPESYVFTPPQRIAASQQREPAQERSRLAAGRQRQPSVESDTRPERPARESGAPMVQARTDSMQAQSGSNEGGLLFSEAQPALALPAVAEPDHAQDVELQEGMAPLPAAASLPAVDGEASTAYRLRAGDPIVIHLRGIPEAADYEYIIDDSGYINLPYISRIQAVGLTASELQQEIHRRYIDEKIYRQISVNVLNPSQRYYVQGEVRQPGAYPLRSGMTLLRAIAAAGGYTEFAQPRRVEITRDGETERVNARDIRDNPETDVELKAGDVIDVKRSFF